MATTYLEITMKVSATDRPKAGEVYSRYKPQFLATVRGARSKDLLLREEDVQVLHAFDLRPYLQASPEIRIYECQ
jgi:hypothetical protein